MAKRATPISAGAAIALAIFLAASVAHAERRVFGATYEPVTNGRGYTDLLIWNEQTRAELDASAEAMKWQVELQFGILDRWDAAFYQVFAQAPNVGTAEPAPLAYAETKLETRYLLAERGAWPIDVMLYFEVEKSFGADQLELEPKVIVGRVMGPWRAALNLAGGVEIADGETKLVPGYAVGVAYAAAEVVQVGVESWGEVEEEVTASGSEKQELSAWAGPTVHWQPSPVLFVTLRPGFGLTSSSAELRTLFILGLSWLL